MIMNKLNITIHYKLINSLNLLNTYNNLDTLKFNLQNEEDETRI
jgi:hypothetical protein